MPSLRPAFAAALIALAAGPPARAAELDAQGHLVFASDALRTYGFEKAADLAAIGSALSWASTGRLQGAALDYEEAAQWLIDDALEGGGALAVRAGLGPGLALQDDAFFAGLLGRRISVTFWGRAFGAEPALEVVYARNNLGPSPLGRVIAVRTGRETSDGWAEYTTGPIDASVFGHTILALILTARYATDQGASLLVGGELAPTASSLPQILDSSAYAVIDAVEVRPESGAALDPQTCTVATAASACEGRGECMFGRCVDGALVHGPVPPSAEDRRDLVARWAFYAQHLLGDRRAAATAASTFAGAADALAQETAPSAFYGGLKERVTGLRDSHTSPGHPPSTGTVLYPLADRWSGALDVCLGLAENDLDGGAQAYAVFAVGGKGSIAETLAVGDVLTRIDGMEPGAWIASLITRAKGTLSNDPAGDPSEDALVLSRLIGRYASTVTFSRCQVGGGCAALPVIHVADQVAPRIDQGGGYDGSSIVCTPRFHASVASPPSDTASKDAVVVETAGGITSVQFNGYTGVYDATKPNPYAAWEDPMATAFTPGAKVLVDARIGNGGKFSTGRWLFHLLRGTDQPYGAFSVPRGAYDDPDPSWLFDSKWDACVDTWKDPPNLCGWAGGSTFTSDPAPAGATATIAWVNGDDVSMSDIVPRLLVGRSGFRIFGPHASHGAYGFISRVPPLVPSWSEGSLQVFDTRFGATPVAARAAPWESGTGVPPDEIVIQKVSHLLQDEDTLLEAARAWLSQ
jgi:hypothetical protein